MVAGHAERRAVERPCSAPAGPRRGCAGRGPRGRRRRPPCGPRGGRRRARSRGTARRGVRPRPRSRAAPSSSSSSSQQPWTSPMMSNGPCSSRRSFQSGTRSTVAASTSSGVSRTKTCRKPSLRSPRSDRRSCDVWLRTTCGPKSRSGRGPVPLVADPLGQVEHDGHRQAVILPGQLDQRLAGLGLDVGGVDDRQPPQGQPLAGDEPEHLEGVLGDGLVVLVVADHRPGRRRTRGSRSAGNACGRTCSCPSRWGRSGRRG